MGNVVWISVRDVPATGPALCDLEVRPELQGSVMVIEDGKCLESQFLVESWRLETERLQHDLLTATCEGFTLNRLK